MIVDLRRIKPVLRKAVAWAFHASPVCHWRHRGKVVMLMYHRVLDANEVLVRSGSTDEGLEAFEQVLYVSWRNFKPTAHTGVK